MSNLQDYDPHGPAKILAYGQSGTGKTGSLAALADAGYKLWIIDYDNGIAPLAQYVTKKENVEYETFTDKLRTINGQVIPDGQPKALSRSLNQLDKWKINQMDSSNVVVIDSLTKMGEAAMRHTLFMNGRQGSKPYQSDWGDAQGFQENLLALLYADNIRCNVVVFSHVTYITREVPGQKVEMNENNKAAEERDVMVESYPSALGQKMPPKVPTFFNTMVYYEIVGTKRVIRTQSQLGYPVKVPAKVRDMLPIETGLLTIVNAIGGKNG